MIINVISTDRWLKISNKLGLSTLRVRLSYIEMISHTRVSVSG